MKKMWLLFFLLSINCFSQVETEKELRTIIKELIKIRKKNGYSELKLIADNTDSTFYKSNKIILYTNRSTLRNKNVCRTLSLDFINRKKVYFQDCQSCSEISSCYIVTDKTEFEYKIINQNNQVYFQFQNKYGLKKYLLNKTIKDETNKIVEIELIKI